MAQSGVQGAVSSKGGAFFLLQILAGGDDFWENEVYACIVGKYWLVERNCYACICLCNIFESGPFPYESLCVRACVHGCVHTAYLWVCARPLVRFLNSHGGFTRSQKFETLQKLHIFATFWNNKRTTKRWVESSVEICPQAFWVGLYACSNGSFTE